MNSRPLNDVSSLRSDQLLKEASTIMESIELSWTKGKRYSSEIGKLNFPVQTQTYVNESLNNDYWAARVTVLDHSISEEIKAQIYSNLNTYIVGSLHNLVNTHTEYEKQYIHELYDYELKSFSLNKTDENYESNTYMAKLYYKLPFPLKKRIFYELIHILLSKDGTHAYVISQAVEPSTMQETIQSGFVRGRYTSIEKVSYENGSLKWLMTTCSDPGGSVPNFITKFSILGAIVKDVPSFLTWSLSKS